MSDNLTWRKSSYSGGTGGNCVEIAALPDGGRAVRDSKNPDGSVLCLTSDQWAELVKSLLPATSTDKRNPAAIDTTDSGGILYALAS